MSHSKPTWQFNPRHPASKIRDPVQGEFFTSSSIDNMSDAVVREAVQNSLDAATHWPVKIHIYHSGTGTGLPPQTSNEYFSNFWPHATACDQRIVEYEDCINQFIVFEDYNTTGLTGNPQAIDPPLDTDNDFYYFFRAEGRSAKSGKARGRWGVGKYVFPMASQINAFFVLTRTQHGATLLLGQAILQNHTLGGEYYEPDGWWSDWRTDGLPLPIQQPDILTQFSNDWNLTRLQEPGTSVIVPHIDTELTPETLLHSLVRDYYIAIITGNLEAEVATPDWSDSFQLDARTLTSAIDELPDPDSRQNLHGWADLARWGLHEATTEDTLIIAKQDDAQSPRWSGDLFEEAQRQAVYDAIEQGKRMLVRVPIYVSAKDSPPGQWSHVDVLIEGEENVKQRPVFVREGIRVSEIDHGPLYGVRAILLGREPAVARMLGDAEGPAHVDWTPQNSHFRNKYVRGRDWLSFIKRAPGQIVSIARSHAQEQDLTVAAPYFSIPQDIPPTDPKQTKRSKGKGSDAAPTGNGPTSPRTIEVGKLSDGFSVYLSNDSTDIAKLAITVAYDVSRGDPFKRWDPADFSLEEMSIESTGADTSISDNTLHLNVYDTALFHLRVRGFDTNRDLRVRTRVEERHA